MREKQQVARKMRGEMEHNDKKTWASERNRDKKVEEKWNLSTYSHELMYMLKA